MAPTVKYAVDGAPNAPLLPINAIESYSRNTEYAVSPPQIGSELYGVGSSSEHLKSQLAVSSDSGRNCSSAASSQQWHSLFFNNATFAVVPSPNSVHLCKHQNREENSQAKLVQPEAKGSNSFVGVGAGVVVSKSGANVVVEDAGCGGTLVVVTFVSAEAEFGSLGFVKFEAEKPEAELLNVEVEFVIKSVELVPPGDPAEEFDNASAVVGRSVVVVVGTLVVVGMTQRSKPGEGWRVTTRHVIVDCDSQHESK